MIDTNDTFEDFANVPEPKFIKIEHPDGSVEYRAENIDELNALSAEYESRKTNKIELTEEQVAEAILNQKKYDAREYLKSTDWYAARLAETGTPIPEEILEKRQAARQLLSS
jgi:hypothetical protein